MPWSWLQFAIFKENQVILKSHFPQNCFLRIFGSHNWHLSFSKRTELSLRWHRLCNLPLWQLWQEDQQSWSETNGEGFGDCNFGKASPGLEAVPALRGTWLSLTSHQRAPRPVWEPGWPLTALGFRYPPFGQAQSPSTGAHAPCASV